MKLQPSKTLPLPVSWNECRQRGWNHLDILLITGDTYIDHPSFGVALIGRLLESHGYNVAILAQPRFDTNHDFISYPAPRLFCGITAGNLDSIVANYTSNGKVREQDSYSPNGNPWRDGKKEKKGRRRPDRATIVYTTKARSAYPGVPIVLGGIEASLRRFTHYDFKQDKLRASILTDAKADILVYGMGEKAILEIASRCHTASPQPADLTGINGTCLRLTEAEMDLTVPAPLRKSGREMLFLPSYEQIISRPELFLDAEIEIDKHARAYSSRRIYQRQQSHWLLQFPASKPLTSEELDHLYDLPFTRRPNPPELQIPALRMIQDSVTIVRGCSGNCSFCAISRHQGPAIISRSNSSIIKECQNISRHESFRGTISDLGGPTANLFGSSCKIGSCKKRDCLHPQMCPNLQLDEQRFLDLLQNVGQIENIKNVFISSGLRMEPLLKTPQLLRKIITSHTPGALKIAPEHTEKNQLHLMHKEHPELLQRFVKECRRISSECRKKVELTPYLIISHPGSTEVDARKLVTDLNKLGLQARQFQDFTPTPGTLSTAMYVAALAPHPRTPIPVPKNQSERLAQRRILEGQYYRKSSVKDSGKKRKR